MKVCQFLNEKHVRYDVLEHSPTFDSQHMAAAVHITGDEVAKSVLMRADHGFRYVLVVVPASRKVDFEAVSDMLGHSELQIASEKEVSEVCPDCESGVLVPFGSQYGAQTLLDSALSAHDTIAFEGNTHHETIRMKMADFCHLESPIVAPISIAG
jgi:Ala-tRNA(Pro) deacylase